MNALFDKVRRFLAAQLLLLRVDARRKAGWARPILSRKR
jgi:hypothetical protein